MTEAIELDEAGRLHLGGYLVYQLADFRTRFGHRLLGAMGLASSSLSNKVREIFSTKDYSQLAPQIEDTDRTLVELNELIEELRSTRQKDFLMPLYQNCRVFLRQGEHQMREFLELLCNEATLPWNTIRSFCHDVNHFLCALAGDLYSLQSHVARGDRDSALAFVASKRATLSLKAEMICPMLEMGYLVGEFRDANMVVLNAYMDTEYHQKAAELLTEVLEAKGASRSHDPQEQPLFAELYRHLQSRLELRDGPHLTPMLNLLRQMAPRDEVDEVLLSDPFVIWLRQQVDEI
jgi:hypothetical protein